MFIQYARITKAGFAFSMALYFALCNENVLLLYLMKVVLTYETMYYCVCESVFFPGRTSQHGTH